MNSRITSRIEPALYQTLLEFDCVWEFIVLVHKQRLQNEQSYGVGVVFGYLDESIWLEVALVALFLEDDI